MKHNNIEVIMSKIAKFFLILFCIMAFVFLAIFTYVAIIISQAGGTVNLDIAKLNSYNSQVKIYDCNNNELVTTSTNGNKTISLSELPDYVPQAFISIEDKQFYKHNGLNIGRIFKAGLKNLISGYAKEGASTITQQLIKNTHLSNEKTLSRKIQEAYLAIQLEKKYDKDDILETYLNVIYFGNGAYGIESAAQNYFGHSAKELTLDESAILAGLIKSPKTYSPILNPDNCIKRRNLVLKNMLDDEIINKADYESAVSKTLSLTPNISANDNFNKIALEQAMDILNLSEKDISTMGFKIYTFINKEIQNEITQKIQTFDNVDNGLMVVDNKTNGVVAYIGNCDINRQVGSTIKPILCYTPAFETGALSPITPIKDETININGYSPKNANNKYLGWVSTRTALAKSLNIPAIKTLEYNNIDKSIKVAKKFGLHFDKEDRHLAIALGATKSGESLATMTNAYSVFARNGSFGNLNFIRKIELNGNNVVYKNDSKFNQIIGKDTAFLVNNILKDCITDGTAKRLSPLNIPFAAKTGTVGTETDSTNTDAWCISYNPKYTVGVWYGNTTGNAENNLLSNQNGGTIATDANKAAWNVLKKHYNVSQDFDIPDTVSQYSVDALSLNNQKIELASPDTPEKYIIKEWFSNRFAPKKISCNFDKITQPVLNMTVQDNLIFQWEGLEYLNYELHKITQNKDTLIKTFEGKNDTLTYSLPLPKENTEFYLTVKYKNNKIDKSVNSNTEKYYIVTNSKKEENVTNKIRKGWFF